jgi:hypothetical protein
MKLTGIICLLLTIVSAGVCGEPGLVETFPMNLEKYRLIDRSYQRMDSLTQVQKVEKSVFGAAVYSAVIPGAGQLYAGSVWKAILFAGIEVASWATYFTYEGKGDREDTAMRQYADVHWVEERYWSWLYYNGEQRDDVRSDPRFPEYTLVEDNTYGGYMLDTYNQGVVESLRFLEEALGHSHKLPTTKTQQYYEMIYKYATQFGNAWDDADFYSVYYGNTNQLTPNMFTYRDMRNQMNAFYDSAKIALNVVLINHLLSALDAALTTRNYNRSIKVNLRVDSRQLNGERIQMYGVNVAW